MCFAMNERCVVGMGDKVCESDDGDWKMDLYVLDVTLTCLEGYAAWVLV